MRRARKALPWIAALLAAVGLAVETAGFLRFAAALPRAPNPDIAGVEAIVVLTGGSGRIAAGLDILAAAPAARLFVTGVHRDADLHALIARLRPGLDAAPERIAAGRAAADTRGNALEAARWAREHGLDRLALVTAAYHMPRALAEFRRVMPGAALSAHPVFTPNVRLDSWWRYWGTTRLLLGEYAKLRLARLQS